MAGLLAGSENHLRAFTRTLANQTGATYVPQYMDQAAYDAVIGSTGSGRQGPGSKGGQGRRP